jgi:hypothetical protein
MCLRAIAPDRVRLHIPHAEKSAESPPKNYLCKGRKGKRRTLAAAKNDVHSPKKRSSYLLRVYYPQPPVAFPKKSIEARKTQWVIFPSAVFFPLSTSLLDFFCVFLDVPYSPYCVLWQGQFLIFPSIRGVV